MAHVSGHVRIVKRKRGYQWYAKYRLPSGRQVQKRLRPAWTERSRPPAGYYTQDRSGRAGEGLDTLRAKLAEAQAAKAGG
jgi:hypothetical protein